jgi:hypothetical protein
MSKICLIFVLKLFFVFAICSGATTVRGRGKRRFDELYDGVSNSGGRGFVKGSLV